VTGAESPTRTLSETLDAKGRVVGVDRPGESPVSLAYRGDGRETSRVQGARTFTFGYDAAGRPSSLTDPAGSVTGLGYDTARRLSSISQPAGVGGAIAIDHDASGNVDSLTSPGGNAHAFAFRPNELRATATPPSLGAVPASAPTVATHDADRALTALDAPGNSDLTFGHAANGHLTSVTGDGAGTTQLSYDSAGRLVGLDAPDADLALGYDGLLPTSQTWSAGVVGSVALTYDADHRVATRAVAGSGAASTITNAYDNDGMLTGVSGAMSATIARSPATGRVTAISTGGGPTVEDLAYSATFGELSGQTVSHGATQLYDVGYTRDALGRVTGKSESFNGGAAVSSSYGYDGLGRLTSAIVGGVPTAYTWDTTGNRTSGGAVYDAQDRLTQMAGTTFTYTADGRLLTRTQGPDTTTYTYDALDQLRAVDLPNTTSDVAYGIDGAGRRVERRVGASVTNRWIYDGEDRIVAELDGSDNLVSSFAYLPGDHTPFLMRAGGTTYRLVSDQAGSIRLVIDTTTGGVAQRIDYDPFGKPTYSGPQPAGFIPFGFAGGQYDPATGLVRMGARDYDPATGRFTAKDPAGFAGGYASLYAYAGGDPVNGGDPSGQGPGAAPPVTGYDNALGTAIEPVARVLSIKNSDGLDRGATNLRYRHEGGPWMDAQQNTVLYATDEIQTDANTVASLDFLIGGRVSINRNTTTTVSTDRGVTDGNLGLRRTALRNADLWFGSDAARVRAPIEIQTNGGTMGIHG